MKPPQSFELTHPIFKLGYLIWALLAVLAIAETNATTVTWTGIGDGTTWTDSHNWSTNAVPAAGDDVTVASRVTLSALDANIGFKRIVVQSGAQVSFPNVTDLSAVTLLQVDGAGSKLTFPSVSSYVQPANTNVAWTAGNPYYSNTGCELNFPALQTITGSVTTAQAVNGQFNITALNGATINLPVLTGITIPAGTLASYSSDGVRLAAYDSGVLKADVLTTFIDNSNPPSSSITGSSGGAFSFPHLIMLSGVASNVDLGGDVNAPDLKVTNLSVIETNLKSGASVTLQWKEQNTGASAAVGVYYDAIHVRNKTTGETVLDAVFNPNVDTINNTLAPGALKDRQYLLRLPDGTRSAGELELTFIVDFQNAIYEGGPVSFAETNNATSINAASTLANYPDLAITNVATMTTNAVLGQQITLTWTAKNNGPAQVSGNWQDQVFLSDDTQVGNDRYLGTFSFNDALAVGASVVRTGTVSLPADGAGNKYLVVVTNAGQDIYELNRTNNGLVAAQQIQIGGYAVAVTKGAGTFVSGLPVNVNGTTYDPNTGALVGNAPVTVRITHAGTVRIISAVSVPPVITKSCSPLCRVKPASMTWRQTGRQSGPMSRRIISHSLP